jgi:hypothetical protein
MRGRFREKRLTAFHENDRPLSMITAGRFQ